jgi:hypothetical protein
MDTSRIASGGRPTPPRQRILASRKPAAHRQSRVGRAPSAATEQVPTGLPKACKHTKPIVSTVTPSVRTHARASQKKELGAPHELAARNELCVCVNRSGPSFLGAEATAERGLALCELITGMQHSL